MRVFLAYVWRGGEDLHRGEDPGENSSSVAWGSSPKKWLASGKYWAKNSLLGAPFTL